MRIILTGAANFADVRYGANYRPARETTDFLRRIAFISFVAFPLF